MSVFKVLILAIVQGLAELLPVSSSAHVVVAEKRKLVNLMLLMSNTPGPSLVSVTVFGA